MVEKHCARRDREAAGEVSVGKDPCLRVFRESCLKQLWGMEQDMAAVVAVDGASWGLECTSGFYLGFPMGISVAARDICMALYLMLCDFISSQPPSFSVTGSL